MFYHSLFIAMRRAMRRHQHVRHRPNRIPMWRLLAGELLWGLRQLAANPWVTLGLISGTAVAFAVLSAAAPGPILDSPWRLLVAIAAGLIVAAGARELQSPTTGRQAQPLPDDNHDEHPLVGAAVISAATTALILVLWLAVWIVDTFA